MMMLVCIKQHRSNIWRSIYEKVKKHWVWVAKSVAYKKEVCFSLGWSPYKLMWKRSCWTFYHPWNRFPQGNDNRVSTSWKWFNIKVYTRSTWFHFEVDLAFYEKTLVKRKRYTKIILTNKKNPEKNWKCSGKNIKL